MVQVTTASVAPPTSLAMVRSIARLAWPTTLVMFAQIAASTFDAWMAGRLGTAALGGFALVFPFVILMQMLAAGGIGGGIAAAVARAIGRGSRADAHDLAAHALIIAACFGLVFTVVMVGFGRPIFAAFAGARSGRVDAAAVDAAVLYASALFGGAIATWIMFALASVFRGLGDAAFPGRWMLVASMLQMPLGFVLTFGFAGWGGLGLGLAGIGVAPPLSQFVAALLMARRIREDKGGLSLSPRVAAIRGVHFRDILRVGLLSSLSALFASLTTMLVTAMVAPYGVAALAGYGLGSRLEYFLTPLTFGIGSALTVLVGQAVGRGEGAQARRLSLIGAAGALGMCGAVGLLACFAPHLWADLFTTDPSVREATITYLRRLGPAYPFFGLGLALAFALQGAARVAMPVSASVLRPLVIAIAVAGGFVTSLEGLYTLAAWAIVLYGGLVLAGFLALPIGPSRR